MFLLTLFYTPCCMICMYINMSCHVILVVVRAGVDEHTALLLDVHSGEVRAVGVGTAYVCASSDNPTVCSEGTPLTFTNIACVRLSGPKEDLYSFSTWTGTGVPYINNVQVGHITTLPYGPKP